MRFPQKSRKVDNYLKEPVVFYCKDCEKIVKVKPVGRKFVYRCAICGTKNVAFGTIKAIKNYYRYEEEETPATAKEEKPTDAVAIPSLVPPESRAIPAENAAPENPSPKA